MLMIDPKMVELKMYEDIPHLLHPIVTDPKLASNALIWAVAEMENRYRTLAECGVRNVDQYNALLKDPEAHRRARKASPADVAPTPQPMHFIVIIIDEFADLMMIAPKDVEDSVTRLAQKARAVGIHLIVATQRPSVDVITGVIKANFPSRISYQVASKIDSRTILDTQGAEKLLGNGDMLFLPPGTARIRERRPAAPAESNGSHLPVRRGNRQRVRAHVVEDAHRVVGRDVADLGGGSLGAKLLASSLVWSASREEVRSDRDEAFLRELVGDSTDPVAETKDLVDYDYHRRLVPAFGIDDEGLDRRPVAALDVHPLAVSWRRLELLDRLRR